MNKLEMAHQWAMKHGKSDNIYNRENTVQLAWEYADAMQSEDDKREKQKAIDDAKASKVFIDALVDTRSLTKDENGNCLHFHHEFGHKKCMDCGACLEEWQPDWSQAPEWANWWAMDKDGDTYWHSCADKPFPDGEIFEIANPQGHTFCAKSFGYKGNWKDSLRKRPD